MEPFKAYDIRGIYPFEINELFAFELGRAVGVFLKAKKLVVGRDGRISSDSLYKSLVDGINSVGCDVINIGRCSTPQYYWEIFSGTCDGGIMITASHNPKEYNGFKICGANAVPIYFKNGLENIKNLMIAKNFEEKQKGQILSKQIFDNYTKFFSSLVPKLDKKVKVLFDTGNGMGITEVKALKKIWNGFVEETVLFPIIDSSFPNHECNPIKEKNTEYLVKELKKGDYDLGFAFDGDADRVVCFTSTGFKIPADIMTAIIAKQIGSKKDKIGYEVRTSQSVISEIEKDGFIGFLYPSGSALMKGKMAEDGVVICGEKSGHYIYQKLHNTDSSLYSIMNIILFSLENDLEKVAKDIIGDLFILDEKNYTVENKEKVLEIVEREFSDCEIKKIDGLNVYGNYFFFNLRKSNTENLVRLNIEGKDERIVNAVIDKIEHVISRY